MDKSKNSKVFITALIILIIAPLLIFGIIAILPTTTTITGGDRDSAIVLKNPGIFDTVPDSVIFPSPDPHTLYPVGLTPETGYGRSTSSSQTVNGYLRKEKLRIVRGPVILLKIDSNTRTIYPYNFVNKFTNVVYLKDAKRIQLFFNIAPRHLSQYRYRVLLNDSTYIQWKQPDGTIFLHDLFPGMSDSSFYVTGGSIPESIKEERKQDESVLLADIDAYNKKITIQLYNLNNPKGATTVILYDKPFDRPKLTDISVSIEKKIPGGTSRSSFNAIDASSSGNFHSPEPRPDVHINELTGFTIGAYRIAAKKFC